MGRYFLAFELRGKKAKVTIYMMTAFVKLPLHFRVLTQKRKTEYMIILKAFYKILQQVSD